jgi:indolepyruvate ferredoxin oxidoreductase beta subunit
VDAGARAEALGNPKVANVLLLGATIKSMGLQGIAWSKILKENVKAELLELNQKALETGMSLV